MIQHMTAIRQLPKFTGQAPDAPRCGAIASIGQRSPLSRLLDASNALDDGTASPAGALLPRNRDRGSYGCHMLDHIHGRRWCRSLPLSVDGQAGL